MRSSRVQREDRGVRLPRGEAAFPIHNLSPRIDFPAACSALCGTARGRWNLDGSQLLAVPAGWKRQGQQPCPGAAALPGIPHPRRRVFARGPAALVQLHAVESHRAMTLKRRLLRVYHYPANIVSWAMFAAVGLSLNFVSALLLLSRDPARHGPAVRSAMRKLF